jgi:MOSC domain-containing protein YiiM
MPIIDPVIASVQIGLPQELGHEKPWTSGIIKNTVSEPVWLGPTGLDGDGQADTVNHGGSDKAVCVYSAEHYPYWQQTLRIDDFFGGSFGENITVAGLIEDDVCIGDVWAIGEATVQVSQPRQPCWKLARRWEIKDLALQVQQTGYTGWYLRTIVAGQVQSGMIVRLTQRPHPEWTITAANNVMYHDKQNTESAARLAALAELSLSWQTTLLKRL